MHRHGWGGGGGLRIRADAARRSARFFALAALLASMRLRLISGSAPVTLRLDKLEFPTGADLLALVDGLHEPVDSPATMVKQ